MTSARLSSVNVNSTPAAYIMSHSTFNFGQQLSQFYTAYQALLLRELTRSTVLKIEFLYIDIGCTSNYNNDTAYIQSFTGGSDTSFSFTCYNLSSDITVSPADSGFSNYVGFSFMINNDEKRGGFLLKYSGMFFSINYITSCR